MPSLLCYTSYQEQYRLTKDKLMTMPKGKQFDFSETQIFGKFDLFCRRVIKLIDMFGTIHQFKALAKHKMEGMEGLITEFFKIIDGFKAKRHDLLGYHNNQFDRDYVEFNVKISELEGTVLCSTQLADADRSLAPEYSYRSLVPEYSYSAHH
jgi:dynein heavy chain